MKNIDPNLLIALVTALGTYVWNRVHHTKQPSIEEIAKGIAIGEVAAILSDPARAANARARVTAAIYAGLEKAGIKRSTLVDLAVSAAVERALGEIAKQTLDSRLGKLGEAADAVTAEWDRAEARGKAAGVPLGVTELVPR